MESSGRSKSRRKENLPARNLDKVLPAGIVLVLLLVGAAIYFNSLQKNDSKASDYAAIVVNIERVKKSLYQMEGANNSYLLTSDDDYRKNFDTYRDILSDNYQEVRGAVAKNPVQSAHIKRFKEKLTQWFSLYNPVIIQHRKAESDRETLNEASLQKQKKNLAESKILFDEMLVLLDEVREEQVYDIDISSSSEGI